jgi:hypothetical protein
MDKSEKLLARSGVDLLRSVDRSQTRLAVGGEQERMTTITCIDLRNHHWAARGLVGASFLLADMRVS